MFLRTSFFLYVQILPFPLLSRTFGSPKCWCRCRSALRTSSMWCYATLTGLVRTFWAGCRSSRTADGATTVVTVSAGWGSSSSSSSSLILLSLVPVLEKKELSLIPLIPRVLLFSCVWWLWTVNLLRLLSPSGPQISTEFRDLRLRIFFFFYPPHFFFFFSPLPLASAVDGSEASGLCERGRRLSDSLHPQIC